MEVSEGQQIQLILKKTDRRAHFKKNILLAEVDKTGYNSSHDTATAAAAPEIPTGREVTNLGPLLVFSYCMIFAV